MIVVMALGQNRPSAHAAIVVFSREYWVKTRNFQLSTFNFQLCVVSLRPTKPNSTSAEGAEIAQVVERFTRNEKVAGSSPAFGSKTKGWHLSSFGFLFNVAPRTRDRRSPPFQRRVWKDCKYDPLVGAGAPASFESRFRHLLFDHST